MVSTVAAALALGLFIGPLVGRLVLDRRRERADSVAADVRAAIRRRLGGESMISVAVDAPGVWARGRISLYAPRGYEWLIAQVWPALVTRIPPRYDLVVRVAPEPAPEPMARQRVLPRAA